MGFLVLATRKMESQNIKQGGGRGEGPYPLPALLLTPFYVWSLTLVPCSWLKNYTEMLAIPHTNSFSFLNKGITPASFQASKASRTEALITAVKAFVIIAALSDEEE